MIYEGDALMKKALVITTNEVQKRLCDVLSKRGLSADGVEAFDNKIKKDKIRVYDMLVLPFAPKEKKPSFLPEGALLGDYLSHGQLVVGGMFSDGLIKEIEGKQGEYADYFSNEAYVLKNAYITSQGALRLLLETTSDFLVGKKVLITGFGRIGKSLAGMLKAIGMKVFVAVRSEIAATEAAACGFEVFKISQTASTLFYYDYIFNTVPERIFEKNHIKHIRDDAYYFELASFPFGADKADFSACDKHFVNGSALPGRYFSLAVAENMAAFIFSLGR